MNELAILLVDDEPMVLEGLAEELQRNFGQDYQIEAAESGEEALEILQESSSNSFQFKADSICWRDRCLNILEIEAARQHFFRSFGSCSFQEPVSDLKHLKLLS